MKSMVDSLKSYLSNPVSLMTLIFFGVIFVDFLLKGQLGYTHYLKRTFGANWQFVIIVFLLMERR